MRRDDHGIDHEELEHIKRLRGMTVTEFKVDEKGFADFTELERDWFYLQEMIKQQQVLEAGIEKCKAAFKEKMLTAGATGFSINGVKVVTFKQDATFPVAKYSAENPAVAAAYTTMKPTFDLEAFKRDRPEEYKNWRSNTFKFVQPKQGAK